MVGVIRIVIQDFVVGDETLQQQFLIAIPAASVVRNENRSTWRK